MVGGMERGWMVGGMIGGLVGGFLILKYKYPISREISLSCERTTPTQLRVHVIATDLSHANRRNVE